MRHNKYRSSLGGLLTVLVTAFVATGCTKEDLSGCDLPEYSLQVKGYDADGKEVDAETIKDITLYVFDKDKAFLGLREVALTESVILDYPGHEALTVVAWGNGKQGHQMMPTLKKGDPLETAFVSLIKTRTSLLPEAVSPDDLFYGSTTIEAIKAPAESAGLSARANTTAEKVLPVIRKTSSVVVTTRYLREYVGSTEGEFRYSLRKSSDKLDFYGKANGMDVSYHPAAAFTPTGDLVSSRFNILPTDIDIKIDIFHRDVLQTTIISDSQGKPLRAVEGQLLNVFINFKGSINVDVKVTEWGKKKVWKEF